MARAKVSGSKPLYDKWVNGGSSGGYNYSYYKDSKSGNTTIVKKQKGKGPKWGKVTDVTASGKRYTSNMNPYWKTPRKKK